MKRKKKPKQSRKVMIESGRVLGEDRIWIGMSEFCYDEIIDTMGNRLHVLHFEPRTAEKVIEMLRKEINMIQEEIDAR